MMWVVEYILVGYIVMFYYIHREKYYSAKMNMGFTMFTIAFWPLNILLVSVFTLVDFVEDKTGYRITVAKNKEKLFGFRKGKIDKGFGLTLLGAELQIWKPNKRN